MQRNNDYIERRTHGREAFEAVGIPHEFAAQLMLLADQLGITIALRAGEPDQLYSQSAQPKQSSIKQKSGDWGLTKSVISDDAELGRYKDDQPINLGKQRPDGIGIIQHHLTLQSILKRLNDNCEVIGVAGDRYLLVKCKDAPTENARDYVYRINMMQGIESENINMEHINVSPTIKRKKPEWWKDVWGNFHDMMNNRFPVEYLKDMGASYEPLMIYASKNKQGQLIPVTSDMDLLWISSPDRSNSLVAAAMDVKGIDILEIINTFKEDKSGIKEMRAALEIINEVDPEKRLNLNLISDERLGSIGCATPFEAYVMFVVNHRFSEYANHLGDLLQHGADNRSPYAPSEIEKTLHIIGGESIITENEKDLIQFMLQRPDYLSEYDIDIHPEVSMKKWHKVVEKQLSLNQDISKPLLDHYLEEKYADSSSLARRASTGLETLKGRIRSFSLIASPQPRRKSSIGERQRRNSFSDPTQERRASAPSIRSPEPVIRLTNGKAEIYKEEDAFLSKPMQKNVQQFCRRMSSDHSDWEWNMPIKGMVHANNRNSGAHIYFQITNNSIDLHTSKLTEEAAQALYDLKQVISPNLDLTIHASAKVKDQYLHWVQHRDTESKKL